MGTHTAVMRPVLTIFLAFIIIIGATGLPEARGQDEIDFSLSGEYRARGYFFNHFLAGEETGDKNLSFLRHRLQLNPQVNLGDEAAIHTKLTFLNDRLWGEDELPAFAGTADTAGVEVTLDRAWGEVSLPVLGARVSVGRMGLHWGRGILFNSGDAPNVPWGDSWYGDTYDQILVDFRPVDETSDLHVLLGIGKLSEGGEEYWYGGDDDDMDQYLAAVVYDTSFLRAGVLLAGHFQPSTSTGLVTGDAQAMIDLIKFRSEFEVLYRYGETEGIPDYNYFEGVEYNGKTIHQFGWAWEMRLKDLGVDPLEDFAFEVGGATGDSTPDNWNVTAFTFDPDYNVSLLLFEDLLRRKAEAEYSAWAGSFENAAVSLYGLSEEEVEAVKNVWSARLRTLGGVSNAVYLKPTFSFVVPTLEELIVTVAFLWARARVGSDPDGDGKGSYNLGEEFDLGARYLIGEYSEIGVQMGYLISGDYFDYIGEGNAVRKALPVSTVQGRFTIRF